MSILRKYKLRNLGAIIELELEEFINITEKFLFNLRSEEDITSNFYYNNDGCIMEYNVMTRELNLSRNIIHSIFIKYSSVVIIEYLIPLLSEHYKIDIKDMIFVDKEYFIPADCIDEIKL